MQPPMKRRPPPLKLAALASAAALALFALAALTAPSAAAPPPAPGSITIRAGNYIGDTTTETFTFEKQVFNGSTDCTSGGGAVVTLNGVDQATGHTIALTATDSVLLTVPQSIFGGGPFLGYISEQNGLFVGWGTDVANQSLLMTIPGPGNQVCIRGTADPGPHDFIANFYAGIEMFDSCGNERYVYRPGETILIKVTGGIKFQNPSPPEPHRFIVAGGSPNECVLVPPPPDFTTVHVTSDPFTYSFTIPASDAALPAHCASSPTTSVTGTWRVVPYDSACGCNRNDVKFTVQADAPIPSCPLTGCPSDIEQQAASNACGANVNFTPPSGAPGETVNCDHAPGSFFPVGTTTVTCTGSLGGECAFDVTVNDGTDPTITPPANINAGTDADACHATLNPGTATASDACGVNVQGVRDDAQPLNAPYPLGTTTITWTATDPSGNTVSAQQTVTVVDDDPPDVSDLSASPSVLWPPNHTLRDVVLSYAATDNCGPVNCSVTSVTSNEPADGTGDGDTSPDFELIGPTLVRLRAERSGGGSGRVYTVTVTCTDGANSTSKTVNVSVPKSQKK